MGKKKQPHYRIVAADSRAPRDGRFVENLGYYNPIPNPAALKVDLERVEYWVGRGAIVSPTVGSLVSKARAGGDESVALVGARSDQAANADAAAENGVPAEAAGDAEDVAGSAGATDHGAAADADEAEAEETTLAASEGGEPADAASADSDTH